MIGKIILLATIVAITFGLDCHTYDKAYLAIDEAITENNELIPPLVRLAFHDCVGKSCDACLNLEDGSNSGLADIVDTLEKLYKDNGFDHKLSRSDFWQLASHVALVRGGLNRHCDVHKEKCNFVDLQFKYGRHDCKTSPVHYHDDDSGDAHGDYNEVWRVVHGNFGLNDKEIVTLFGAHSLGGCHRLNSGFKYNWQLDHLTFDNQYYKNLVTLPYTHEDVSIPEEEGTAGPPEEAEVVEAAAVGDRAADGGPASPRLEFGFLPAGGTDLVMLNTDISLWKYVKAVTTHGGHYTGKIECPVHKSHRSHGDDYISIEEGSASMINKCKDTKTTQFVYEYAHHLDKFYHDFGPVWWKMTSHGCPDLKVPGHGHEQCGYYIPDGGYCVKGFRNSAQCSPGSRCVDNKCTSKYY